MILISVDDHVIEPPDMFVGRLPGKYADDAPRMVHLDNGTDVWNAMRWYQFDPFTHVPREQATVGALRASVAGHDVPIKPRSHNNPAAEDKLAQSGCAPRRPRARRRCSGERHPANDQEEVSRPYESLLAKGEDRRQHVLEVALRMMATGGGRATTLGQVARAAGVSTAGLLHHFASKEQLLHAVLDARDAQDEAIADLDGDLESPAAQHARAVRTAPWHRSARSSFCCARASTRTPRCTSASCAATAPGWP